MLTALRCARQCDASDWDAYVGPRHRRAQPIDSASRTANLVRSPLQEVLTAQPSTAACLVRSGEPCLFRPATAASISKPVVLMHLFAAC